MLMMQIKKKVYIPVFFCCEGLSVYLQKKNKEGVGRISSNLGYKIQKIYMAGKLFAHNVWGERTQIEYTSQKMAQTIISMKIHVRLKDTTFVSTICLLRSIALHYRIIK